MIQRIKKITRPVAQVETNLIAISTLQIPMLAKEGGKRVLKSKREDGLKLRLMKRKSKVLLNLKGSEGERKRFQWNLLLNKSQKYY